MNPNPDAYGYRIDGGAYRLEGFSFVIRGSVDCTITPESLAWGEIGNQPHNVVYVSIRLSGAEPDANGNLRMLDYGVGLDMPFGCLIRLLEDIDALRSGESQELRFPSGIGQVQERTEFVIRSDPQWGHCWLLEFRSCFPFEWSKPSLPLAWNVDQPPDRESARHDPFALKLLVRSPVDGESLAMVRDQLRHFIQWLGEKAPGC